MLRFYDQYILNSYGWSDLHLGPDNVLTKPLIVGEKQSGLVRTFLHHLFWSVDFISSTTEDNNGLDVYVEPYIIYDKWVDYVLDTSKKKLECGLGLNLEPLEYIFLFFGEISHNWFWATGFHMEYLIKVVKLSDALCKLVIKNLT